MFTIYRYHRFLYTLWIFLGIIPGMLFAYRPFITDDAGTVPPVTFELELAADYWNDDATFGAGLKHGLTERMDLGISFARCVLPEDASGYDPAELSLKFNIIPDRFSTSFAGSFGSNCYSTTAIYSHSFSPIELHCNGGFSTESTLEESFATFGVAIIVPLPEFSIGMECGGSRKSFNWWQIGGRYEITPSWAVDAALGGDFSSDLSWIATTGLFIAFPNPEKGE